MSFNIRNIREISTDPTSKFISHLAKKISEFANANQTQDLENKEDIYSNAQDVDTVIKFHSLNSSKRFDFVLPFYPPIEPDLDKNTLWLQGRNMGNNTLDLSGFNNENYIWGDAILIDGTPFDYGIHSGGTKSVALRFNRIDGEGNNHANFSIGPEHIGITDNTRIRLAGATSMSWFFRVRVAATNEHNGHRRTIYLKHDTPGATSIGDITDGIRLSIDDINKRLVIQIKKSSVFTSKETGANTFLTNNIYDFFVTYDTGTIKLYMAKTGDSTMTDMTLQNSGYGEQWQDTVDLPDADARIFKRGPNSDDGAVHGDFWDMKIYRNYTITQTDANRHWTNKWTYADIPFGQVMITDYYATYIEDTVGYDSVGYDSTGYDTS